RSFSLGVATNRDEWVYSYAPETIRANVRKTFEAFDKECSRYAKMPLGDRKDYKPDVREAEVKWTDRLVEAVTQGATLAVDSTKVRRCLYRPFDRQYLYFDHLLNQRRYQQHHLCPAPATEEENRALCVNSSPGTAGIYCLATALIPDLDLTGDSQCFPFYTYDEDGSNRRENITDWALNEFRTHCSDTNITKWDILHYVYAVLHHPEYRERYAANLKRELPRIPFGSATADPSTLQPKGRVGNEVSPEGETNVAQGVSPVLMGLTAIEDVTLESPASSQEETASRPMDDEAEFS